MIVRLGWRLLRGGGPGTLARLGLMSLGTAALVFALLSGYAVADSLSTAAHRASSRLPDYARSGVASFRVDVIDDNAGTRPLTRVLLAAPAHLGRDSWTPPGLPGFPRSGETYASPALLALVREQPELRRRLDVDLASARPVSVSGLTGPQDLIEYRGLSPTALRSAPRAVGWGVDSTAASGVSATEASLELGLLVGLPAVLVLIVCARLSSATRLRRMRALQVLGLSARRLAYVAALEGRLAGLVGAGLALAAYRICSSWLASGPVGYSWFAVDTALPLWAVVVVLLLTPVVVGRACRLGALRFSDGPSLRTRAPHARLVRLVPVWVGVVAVAAFIVLRRQKVVSGSGGVAALLFLGGSATLVLGFVLALRPAAERGAAVLAERVRAASLRLAARRIEDDAASTTRLLTALVILIVTVCIGTAVLRDLSLSAGTTASSVELETTAGDLATQAQRRAVADIPAQAGAITLSTPPSIAAGQAPSADPGTAALQLGVPVVFASCADVARLTGSLSSACRDGTAYRVTDVHPGQFVNPLPIGHRLSLTSAGNSPTLTVPAAELRFAGFSSDVISPGGLVVTGRPPLIPRAATVVALVPSTDNAITAYQDALARIAPLASADVEGRDLTTLQTYRTNAGIIHFGVAVGFALALCALGAALVDRQRERRRTLALLMSVGAPRRFVRTAQAAELVAPAAVTLVLASVVGFLVGTGYLTLGGLQSGIYWPALTWGLALSAAAALVLAVIAALLRQRGDGAYIRRE